jgi:hypothetical protein
VAPALAPAVPHPCLPYRNRCCRAHAPRWSFSSSRSPAGTESPAETRRTTQPTALEDEAFRLTGTAGYQRRSTALLKPIRRSWLFARP